jgi:hypothetical protein
MGVLERQLIHGTESMTRYTSYGISPIINIMGYWLYRKSTSEQ